jgi:hypothetical protein
MNQPEVSRAHKRRAVDTAAREFREARGSEHDEIVAARRALRAAERRHDHEVAEAERELGRARAPEVVAAFGHELVLYDDRVSTCDRTHPLTSDVSAHVTGDGTRLVAEGPGWREEVSGSAADADSLRDLAAAIEEASRHCDAVASDRRDEMDSAEERLAAARAERLAIEEAKPLLDRVAELTEDGECVLDMAPGITTGHEGVLVVTDRRILFVGLRLTLRRPLERVDDVSVKGRLFGSRLIVSGPDGKTVVSGIDPRHAAELAELAERQIDAQHSHA